MIKHYGTIRVPGVNAVCYKVSGHYDPATLPKGYREVGRGRSYAYVTGGKRNAGSDVVTFFRWRTIGAATWSTEHAGQFLGKTRRAINRRLADAEYLTPKDAATIHCRTRPTTDAPREWELEIIFSSGSTR